MQIKNVLHELESNPEGSFLDVAQFNQHSFGACSITGVSAVWEMHPDTDEFFYVIEGEFELTILNDGGESRHRIPAGSTIVVPKGLWHKPAAPKGVKLLYFTPGESLHSEAEDPRTENEN